MRHGKAVDAEEAFNDFERPLQNRGRKEAEQTAEWLKEKGIHPEMILSSPATRTAGTAQVVANIFEYPVEHIVYHAPLYMGRAHEYIAAINNLKANCILVVGHNPEMQALAYHFAKVGQAGFPPASAVVLEFEDAAIHIDSTASMIANNMIRC